MLVAAALLPETALLVPGAAGAAEVLVTLRRAALAALTDVLAGRPHRVVVVAAGPRAPLRRDVGSVTLAGAGIDTDRLGWTARDVDRVGPTTVQDVGAAVAVLGVRHVGWSGPLDVVTVDTTQDAGELARLGAEVVAGQERTALVLAGSLSARRGPDGPLPDAPRAAVLDGAVLTDLADLGATARDRLAAVPAEDARELAVTAWAPWQVLLGAATGDAPRLAEVRHVEVPFGATYAVGVWTWA